MELPSNISKDLTLRLHAAGGEEKTFIKRLAAEDKAGLIDLVAKCLADTTWRKKEANEQFLGMAIKKLSKMSERGVLNTEQRTKIVGMLLNQEHHAEKLVRGYWSEHTPVITKQGTLAVPLVALASYSDALRLAVTRQGFKEQATGEVAFPEVSEDTLDALQRLLAGDATAIYLMSPEDILGLLDFCNQYEITEPLKQIDHYLITYMSPDDVLDTYLVAKRYGRQDVVEKALTMFRDAYDPEDSVELALWAKENDATEIQQHIENIALNRLTGLLGPALRCCESQDKADELLNRYHDDKENAKKTWPSTLTEIREGLKSGAAFEKLKAGPRAFLNMRDVPEISSLQPVLDELAKLSTLYSLGDVGNFEIGSLGPEMAEALLRLLDDAGIKYERVSFSGMLDVDCLLEYLPSKPSTLVELDLSHTSGLDQEGLERLVRNHPHLSVLKLPSGAHFDDLSCIGSLKQLTALDISGQPISGDQLIAIARGCPNLSELSMGRQSWQDKITAPDEVFRVLAESCPRLKALDVGFCFENLSALAAATLGSLRLSSLGIAGVHVDEPEVFAQTLSCMKALETLDISWLTGYDDSILLAISANCPKCKALNLSGVHGVSYEAVGELIRTHGYLLEEINLSHCKEIDDEKALMLAVSLPRLKSLILNYCSLTAEGIEGLLGLKDIKKLGLSGLTSKLNEESREALFTLICQNPNLESLTLRGAGGLGDDVMLAIGGCRALKTLDIAYCTLFSQDVVRRRNDLPEMASLVNLEELDVSGSTIRETNLLRVIRHAPRLKSLYVNDLNQLSRQTARDMVRHDLANLEALSMNWVPCDALGAFIAYEGVIDHMIMPKLERLSLRGHRVSEREHYRLISQDSDSLASLRFLDLQGADVDEEFLKQARHLEYLNL